MIKTEKISGWTLKGCVALIIIVFALFLIGYGEEVPVAGGEMKVTSSFDEALIWLMYLLVIAAGVLSLWAGARGVMASSGGKKGENLSGVPGGMVSTLAVGALIVSLVVGALLGIGESAYTAMDGTVTDATWVQISDMFIFSIYILSALTALGVILNMTGIFKK